MNDEVRRTRRTGKARSPGTTAFRLISVACCLLPVASVACRDEPTRAAAPGAATRSAETKPHEAPKIPGQEEEDLVVRTTTMIADTTYRKPETYTQNEKAPSGTLRGLCYIPGKGVKGLGRQDSAWSFEGEGAINSPSGGELDYYKNLKITRPANWWLADKPNNRGMWGVDKAVVMLKDVKTGPLPPLARMGFTSQYGKFTAQIYLGYGLTDVGFSPPGERVLFGTVDSYHCQIVATRAATGQKVFEGGISAYGKLKDPNEKDDARGGRPDPRQFNPQLLQSDPITEVGAYRIACKRHPWQQAWLWVVENPYVTEASPRNRGNPEEVGLFTLTQVPAGRHTLQVWHPAYEPVERTLTVEVEANKVMEILVEFRIPPGLPGAPEKTATTMTNNE